MKCGKFVVLSLLLVCIVNLGCAEVLAKSKFSNSYVVNEGTYSEKPTEVFSNPYCFYKGNGIEIWGEETATVNLPMDGDVTRDLLVINTGDKRMRAQSQGEASVNGKMAKYTEGQYVVFHPNPLQFELDPGESGRAILTVTFGNNLNRVKSDIKKASLTINQDFVVEFKTANHNNGQPERSSFNLSIPVTCNFYTDKTLNAASKKTATICGYVKNSTGKAIKNANVEIDAGFLRNRIITRTNSKGYYSVRVYPSKNSYNGKWHEYVVKVDNNKGYGDQSAVVYPAKDKKTRKSFTLKKASAKLSYTQVKRIDLGVQAYSFSASENGSVIAFIPFHSGLSDSKLNGKLHLTSISKSGKLLFQNALPGETPYVAVSANGSYIVTNKMYGNSRTDGRYSVPTIWNKNGKEVYSREYFPEIEGNYFLPTGDNRIESRCARLSPDNSLLFVGGINGELYCLDWKKDQVIWAACQTNQVRTIDFSKDGKFVYVSSGDGYLYCYSMDGELQWKSYISSWATDVKVSKKYIAVTVKSDATGVRLLDAKTGVQKWIYTGIARGCGLVFSPDEKLLWYGNDTSDSYNAASSLVFDVETGKVKFALDSGAQMADWTADGNYLAVKTARMLYVYKGKTGERVFEKQIVKSGTPNDSSVAFSLYYSDDGKYIVAAFNKDTSERSWGQAYIFKKQ